MGVRYKGSASGDRLSQTTVYNEDMIQIRHGWSDATEDSDKGLPLSVIQSTPVAVCSTSATEQKKSATVQNFPDFTLLNGREVIVYMANGNSASEPSLSINGSDYFLMESAYWNAGTFLKLRYVSVTVNGTTIQKWLVEQGATNTAAQLNGALTNQWKVYTATVETSQYSNITLPDDLKDKKIFNVFFTPDTVNDYCYAFLRTYSTDSGTGRDIYIMSLDNTLTTYPNKKGYLYILYSDD